MGWSAGAVRGRKPFLQLEQKAKFFRGIQTQHERQSPSGQQESKDPLQKQAAMVNTHYQPVQTVQTNSSINPEQIG